MRRLGLVALLVIAAMGAAAGWLDSQIVRPYTGHRPPKIFVEIPHGTSRWDVAGILKKDDVIRNRMAFELFSLWHIRHPLQAGEYLIDRPLNSKQVFWKIAQGRIFLHYVTIPEYRRRARSPRRVLAREFSSGRAGSRSDFGHRPARKVA
jgi:cell division protein YceG involved in septum cleavage